ncbi:murein DD-endopeptidase MepM/ murein hydrolase activator NlpD [Microbacteriaceae bacterium SG_E_30_P1]|uniref:Murein DD-endopeptidase MepM/ murein hydrolase activator NlpD n=1 Tax=Antiquaquibacter oligotrophicus TaxID=2880260 RepID=A0ABT6KQ42_9MICO|nr:M23 family metallopeptidase [Antiquaquibacter oligotrophicus]MDH6181307.1 murein DD-endopeptidase MepM/ murein hydrolase activator NlpD [Antiquaquibacter oligotrophicus]UDF13000.1 M23 family metallopeptidase [Antiquaquibacter oligotrophicus]
MLRPLAFTAAAALGATMMMPAIAFSEPEDATLTEAGGWTPPPQRVTVDDYEETPLARDGYTVEMPKPPEPDPLPIVSVTPIAGLLTTWPCSAPVNDGFGPRGSGMHNGIDIMCSHGTQLVASAPGVVVEVELGGSWGQYIKIDHGGVATLYSHLIEGSPTVAVGQVVAAGEPIGLVGDSGNASVAHCHFEVWVSGVRVDPMPWLP